MSEYMFGVCRHKVSDRESRRRDRICRQEGGLGYQQIDDSHGTAIGGRWVGWYAGPNYGEPFDRDLASAVLSRVGPCTRCALADVQKPKEVARMMR